MRYADIRSKLIEILKNYEQDEERLTDDTRVTEVLDSLDITTFFAQIEEVFDTKIRSHTILHGLIMGSAEAQKELTIRGLCELIEKKTKGQAMM